MSGNTNEQESRGVLTQGTAQVPDLSRPRGAGASSGGTTTASSTVGPDNAGPEIPGLAVAPVVPLRRNWSFQAIWIGQTTSTLGVSVADLAYPLAILMVTGSAGWAGFFAAIQSLGALLAGLPAGSLADRYNPRTIVVAGEIGRALVTAAVAVGLIGGWLSLPLLLLAAAFLGIGSSVTGAARLLLVRSVVPNSQLTQALTLDEVRQNGAALAGPAIGGALYGLRALAHAAPFLFTAFSFVVALISAAVMRLLPGGASEPESDAKAAVAPPAGGGMLAGVRTLWQQRTLRAALVLIMLVNTVGSGLDLMIIVILRHQEIPSGTIGLVLASGAIGGLAGAPLVKVLHRLPPGVLLIAVVAAWVPLYSLIAVPFGPWWVAVLIFVMTLGIPALRVMIDILVIRRAAPSERGRVVGALMTLIAVGIPAGLAGAGLLLEWLPAQSALLLLAALLAVAALYGATSRDLRKAEWPG